MTWGYLIVMVVVLVLGVALAPKAQAPKAASIEDFDFPTAEEGRPIPVVFGEVDVRGTNVLWYGNLQVKPIRKRSGFSKSTVGYKYHIGTHQGLCHGPVDAVTAFSVGDKSAFSGSITANATININLPNLFGGEQREGGIRGMVDVLMGAPNQTINTYLSAQQGANVPGYRGILSVVTRWDSGPMYIGTTAYPKAWSWRVRRITKGWLNDTCWYLAKAVIGTNSMNPAHVIYQCLTDTRWGMGVDPSLLDDDSFSDLADTLYDEEFGLCLLWNQSASIEEFIQIVLDHIAGGFTLNTSTGKYEVVLIRGDYDPNTLDTYDESDIITLIDYQRQGWGETINEVVLSYTDPLTRKLTTISQQDLANIQSQNARVPIVINMKGIINPAVAQTVVARELVSRVTPLSKITFEVNRRAWAIRYAGLFKFQYAPRSINGTIYRVLKVSKGTLQAGAIRIEALEDIYSLGVVGSTAEPVAPGTDPDPPDTPVDQENTGANVISTSTVTPPVTPDDGDSYVIPGDGTGTGAWTGHEGEVADWDEENNEWVFSSIPDNTLVYDSTAGEWFTVVAGLVLPAPWTPDIPGMSIENTPVLTTIYVPTYGPDGYEAVRADKLTVPKLVEYIRGATWSDAVEVDQTEATEVEVLVPKASEILAAYIFTESGVGSCVIDIEVGGLSITAAAKPTILAGTAYFDGTLTGWSKTVTAGATIKFQLESSTGFKNVSIQLHLRETL